MDIDILVEVTGIADFARDGDEVLKGFGNGVDRVERKAESEKQSEERASGGDEEADGAGLRSGRGSFLRGFADLLGALIENHGRFCEPGTRILLKVKDLKIGNGGVARIDLVALGEQRLGKVVGP